MEWVTDGVAAENALVTDEFDLLVLDIGPPSRSGLDILRNLRHQAGSPGAAAHRAGQGGRPGRRASTAVPTTT